MNRKNTRRNSKKSGGKWSGRSLDFGRVRRSRSDGILGNAIITEELSKVDMGIGLNVTAASFGCESIFQYGTEEQKKTYLPPVCSGEKVSAGSFTEPNAGTDVAGYKTRAVKDGSDYIINGNKMFITNGTVCDFMVTQCITNPEEKSTTASA
ncbi:MAG: acyl-CoA dehydrogenase family protein [Candidatus Moduliflexus flocculans]|nr:acyl-CoA dehydrogenase family protein [Candidatus Moduliflexus flocculans]